MVKDGAAVTKVDVLVDVMVRVWPSITCVRVTGYKEVMVVSATAPTTSVTSGPVSVATRVVGTEVTMVEVRTLVTVNVTPSTLDVILTPSSGV